MRMGSEPTHAMVVPSCTCISRHFSYFIGTLSLIVRIVSILHIFLIYIHTFAHPTTAGHIVLDQQTPGSLTVGPPVRSREGCPRGARGSWGPWGSLPPFITSSWGPGRALGPRRSHHRFTLHRKTWALNSVHTHAGRTHCTVLLQYCYSIGDVSVSIITVLLQYWWVLLQYYYSIGDVSVSIITVLLQYWCISQYYYSIVKVLTYQSVLLQYCYSIVTVLVMYQWVLLQYCYSIGDVSVSIITVLVSIVTVLLQYWWCISEYYYSIGEYYYSIGDVLLQCCYSIVTVLLQYWWCISEYCYSIITVLVMYQSVLWK